MRLACRTKKAQMRQQGCKSNNDAVCLGVNKETWNFYHISVAMLAVQHEGSSCSGLVVCKHGVPHLCPVSW